MKIILLSIDNFLSHYEGYLTFKSIIFNILYYIMKIIYNTIHSIISLREAVTTTTSYKLIIEIQCNRNQSNTLGYVTVINYSYPGVHRLLSD